MSPEDCRWTPARSIARRSRRAVVLTALRVSVSLGLVLVLVAVIVQRVE